MEQQVAAASDRAAENSPEFGVVRLAKTILVGDPTLNPEARFAVANVFQGIVTRVCEYPSHTMKFVVAADYASVVISWWGVSTFGFEGIFLAEGLAHNSDLKCRGLTGISQSNSQPEAALDLHNFGAAGNEIGTQLSFGSKAGVPDLDKHANNKTKSRDRKHAGEYREGVIKRLANHPRQVTLISILIGMFGVAIGIAFYLNSRSHLAYIGICLVGISVLPVMLSLVL
jgi:hypothetical protein